MEISFSQAQTWKRCKRQWSFDKVDKRKGIPGMAAIRGNRYHEAIESAIKLGGVSSNRIITNALDLVSELNDVEPEAYLEMVEDNIKIRGYADVIGSRHIPTETLLEPNTKKSVIVDWKFPGKHPGKTPKKEYRNQLQLYGRLHGADELIVAFPEHDTAFKFDYDPVEGLKMVDELLEVAKEIIDSGAKEIPGAEQTPTPNFLCKNYCNFRDICPYGGR